MKLISKWLEIGKRDSEIIAIFGQAKLVKDLEGAYQLVGGSQEDRGLAREWMSLFFHEAVETGCRK